MSKCIYCNTTKKREELHFSCDICGDGMCDDCYDKGTEHDCHIYNPLDDCDSEFEVKIISNKCGNDHPAYICEACMHEIMTKEKIIYIKEDLKKLVGTRWKDKKHLQEYLQNSYELNSVLSDVDESGLVSDYAFIMGIFENYGYMDIYYLKIPHGETSIYITEVNVSEE